MHLLQIKKCFFVQFAPAIVILESFLCHPLPKRRISAKCPMFILSSKCEKKEAQEYFVQNADFFAFYKAFEL